MSLTKKVLFLLLGIYAAALFAIVILELAFGDWLREDKWQEVKFLNLIRDRQIFYSVDNLYTSNTPTILYTRDIFGLRGSCKVPLSIRFLTVGGSTTDQRYIGDGQTYQDVLQSMLLEKLGKEICVSNAGIDGHSTYGHLASFQKWFPLIPNLRPDYYILYIGINDAAFRSPPNTGTDFTDLRIRDALREKSALYGLLKSVKYIFLQRDTSSKAYAGHSKRPPSPADYVADSQSNDTIALAKKNTEEFSLRLEAILAEIKKRDGIPICVSQPHLLTFRQNGTLKGIANVFEYEGTHFNGIDYNTSINALNEAMRSLCPKAGGFYLNIASRKFEVSDFYDAVHMNPRGATRLGQYLFYELQKEGILKKMR